ncbi:SNF2 domain-containing protein CLASSY 1-like [Argentina anserina]|uniref:SNF2 domain-containing protein CLASSY 1-like n=1 Tax=Argentina anserina TaxID=57926 RepID=UPI0021763456|nr:SNF2 domain-containing protein CLASSY 1-like [Potentilla anserina]XP_050369089.1 SNF2 domain-containing protein CLASSY 1-like [Potentilla anserina]XP_050369092.1 SNF2 domain-containing protein CLASSY 1-like [Potentilla anserina]XP_050369099.1 SNF2 domain-containing protein CLASSY 1-like [Potentilla anserina]XP_050369103.1 SNF2 domain-containing protein CLASSY 1-like [Potentilla anserina]
MQMKKRHLYRAKHPFEAHLFEALCCGSWKGVELLRISNGTINMKFVDHPCVIQDKGPFANLRVRSRRSTLYDCICLLRAGVDICVLSNCHTESSDEKRRDPVWVDARISSIEREPHDSQCSCRFHVNFYVNQGPLGSERATLKKETEVIGIDQVSILQRLDRNSCNNQYYRWDRSVDCSTLPNTKLLLGKFLSDLSWLLVTSSLKQIVFDVRSVQSKIVYQISSGYDDTEPSNSGNSFKAVNFQVENGIPIPVIVQLVPDDFIGGDPTCDMHEDRPSPTLEVPELRRSKRRRIQPDRFLACDAPSEIQIGPIRSRPYKIDQLEDDSDDELYLPLSYLFRKKTSNYLEEDSSETEKNADSKRKRSSTGDNDDLFECKENKIKWMKVKSGVAKNKMKKPRADQLAIVPAFVKADWPTLGNFAPSANGPANHSKDSGESATKHYYHFSTSKATKQKRNNIAGLEDMDVQTKWDGGASSSRFPRRGHHYAYHLPSIRSKMTHRYTGAYSKRSLNAGAYKELINKFLKDMDCSTKQETNIMDQWKDFRANKNSDQNDEPDLPEDEQGEEMSEEDRLWKEFDLVLASCYLLGDEESDGATSGKLAQKSDQGCEHYFTLDEEIGLKCITCGFVKTEIKHVTPPFVRNPSGFTDDKKPNEEDPDPKRAEYEHFNFFHQRDIPVDEPISEENENVWALIPELRKKLLFHQKKAFEFLWKNIAGSMEPALMEKKSKKNGGCVISHTPGAGKTFLIIAFLVSYLKLFPGKRPLVLAPKTTLYTWYKEFIKWKIPIPVYLIHGRRTYRVFRNNSATYTRGPKPTDDVMHVLDCLEKIQKWHAQPSVLVMGYTSFLTLMREDSKFVHRRFMAQVLRESPGILVLDEGHNPRSTKSRLRKGLMKVETDLRILLSGTLFQNNFCEYFNTLCLARPKFVNEVLKALDPKYRRKKKAFKDKARHLMEARARKLFLDKIAKKIDSNEGEDQRIEGLNKLRKITNRFIDVYEGGNSDTLPGLQIYTLLMNTTDIQQVMLDRLQQIMATYKGYPLELELLITLGSIHPWLIKTAACADKFFSSEELLALEQFKYDLHKGSKVRFVMNLVYRVTQKEKVLIFCHNIAPVRLFLELFERVFHWERGREVLVLTGDLELFERGKVMDKFEEPGGPSRVLLASITACAEGISLTAASRVILLDSEWNPSKTKQAIARAFRPGQQKVVFVYQLLATGTLEEDKYRRTTWKEWVSSMIFSEAFVEDPSRWQAEKIEDDILREMVGEDKSKAFHMIMKNEKASTHTS